MITAMNYYMNSVHFSAADGSCFSCPKPWIIYKGNNKDTRYF